jgi:hypothetical protein
MDFENENLNPLIFISKIMFTLVIPLISFIPIVLNLYSAFIFSTIENSQTCRFLRINSIIDAISLSTTLLLPLCECQEFYSTWLNNNYILTLYQLYVNYFFNRTLLTFSSLLNLTLAWNQYRENGKYSIKGKLYYLILTIISVFSLALNFPNLFQNHIVKHDNKTEFYLVKVKHVQFYNVFSLIQYTISIIILILTVSLNSVIANKIKSRCTINIGKLMLGKKYQRRYDDSLIKKSIVSVNYLNGFISSNLNECNDLNASIHEEFEQNISKITSESTMVFWITLVFTIDQLIRAIVASILFFINKKKSSEFIIVLILSCLISVLIQFLYFFIYCKFNKIFFKKLQNFSGFKANKF